MGRALVVVDHNRGALRRSAAELAGLARQLGYAPTEVTALVVGGVGAERAAEGARAYFASVWWTDEGGMNHERRTTLVTAAARAVEAELVLMGVGRSAAAVAPRVAWRLGGCFLEDVHALARAADGFVAERLAYLSRANLSVQGLRTPTVVTVKGGMFPPADMGDAGEVIGWGTPPEAADGVASVGARRPANRGRVPLEEATVVVCGGRGLGSEAAYTEHVVGFADDLGAGLAATRAVVDAGWRPYDEQVGQTGKNISPKLYIGLGVSGAVQHLSGMNRSGVVVALNKDPEAPIFKVADYALVGDVQALVPALRAAFAALSD
jgi:electron transfer flavoprotein alpha subunit